MALVAYGSSDESDSESEEISSPSLVKSVENSDNKLKTELKSNNLFSVLPQPKQTLISNKSSQVTKSSVKITIPSLSDFKDEEDQAVPSKKLKPSTKGSGLFALLPPPKNLIRKEANRALVPHVVSKKSEPLKVVKPVKVINSAPVVDVNPASDDSDNEDHPSDFLGLNSESSTPLTSNISEYNVPEPIEDIPNESEPSYVTVTEPEPIANNFIPFNSEDLSLDEEALQKLVGRKRKKDTSMTLIDVSGKEIMPDPNEWMVKQLTEQKPLRSSHKKKDGPSNVQKRKHQITYLAHQAREQELELQNQWANNRLTKRQTQSKYGF